MDTVKQVTHQTVMAVGDGGNDVSMIQCSSVGVGLVGKEGMQAARAADFTITQYQYLHRLMTVHGINNFSRSWTITFFSLYKSIVLCACQCMSIHFSFFIHRYSFSSLFSGASQFNSYYLTYYSIAIFVFMIESL